MVPGLQRTEADSYKIADLLVLVENGGIRIPRFQRGQRWGPGDAVKLFDSIYKGYPIGTLLLWKRPAPADEVSFGDIRIDAPEHTNAYWVVDGQQRISSLATALLPTGRAVGMERAMYFDLDRERFGWARAGGPHESHLPVREAYRLPRVMAWLRERNLEDRMQERAFKLADRLRNYEVPSYLVETEVEGDMAPLQEIFDRINTFGKRMTRAEVFDALTPSSISGGRDLSQLAGEIGGWGFGSPSANTLMLCVLSVRGADVFRDFRTEFSGNPALLSDTIDRARAAIRRTTTFLTEDVGVPHLDLVQYQHLVVALVRFFSFHEKPTEWERVLLRRWYWRAAVHGPLPKLGSTGTLRLALNTIGPTSAYGTVEKLLEVFPSEERRTSLDRFQWNRADPKTALCALANLGPVVPNGADGEMAEIHVHDVLSADRHSALRRVISPSAGLKRGASVANRVFWSAVDDSANETDPAIALAMAEPGVLDSHAISETAAEALRRGDAGTFTETRYRDLRVLVDRFVGARAEWYHPTRPALASL